MNISVFTHTCYSCNKRILDSKDIFCIECFGYLPKTPFSFSDNNIIKDKFKGIISVIMAGSYLYYNKNEQVKELLNQIKYENNTQLATDLGKLMGKEYLEILKNEIDVIIPIPLHTEKYQLRGYNQAELIANGLSEVTGIPVMNHVLKRGKNTISQTKISRENRFQNVNNAFVIQHPEKITQKRILLLDDVITTGATLESAGLKLVENKIKSLSILTLATAFEL